VANVRILLAIDESTGSETALRSVISQANPERTEVNVLTVLERPSSAEKFAVAAASQVAGSPASFASELEAQSQRAQAFVDKAVGELRRAGLKASGTVESGEPKSVIMDAAAQGLLESRLPGLEGGRPRTRQRESSVPKLAKLANST
jgi:hypothetical protein